MAKLGDRTPVLSMKQRLISEPPIRSQQSFLLSPLNQDTWHIAGENAMTARLHISLWAPLAPLILGLSERKQTFPLFWGWWLSQWYPLSQFIRPKSSPGQRRRRTNYANKKVNDRVQCGWNWRKIDEVVWMRWCMKKQKKCPKSPANQKTEVPPIHRRHACYLEQTTRMWTTLMTFCVAVIEEIRVPAAVRILNQLSFIWFQALCLSQTLFPQFSGRTPGKYIMRVRVIDCASLTYVAGAPPSVVRVTGGVSVPFKA